MNIHEKLGNSKSRDRTRWLDVRHEELDSFDECNCHRIYAEVVAYCCATPCLQRELWLSEAALGFGIIVRLLKVFSCISKETSHGIQPCANLPPAVISGMLFIPLRRRVRYVSRCTMVC
jgi:hypothetical protein